MPARRAKALHFGNMEGRNVVFHNEHRTKKGRAKNWHSKKKMAAILRYKRKRIERRDQRQRHRAGDDFYP